MKHPMASIQNCTEVIYEKPEEFKVSMTESSATATERKLAETPKRKQRYSNPKIESSNSNEELQPLRHSPVPQKPTKNYSIERRQMQGKVRNLAPVAKVPSVSRYSTGPNNSQQRVARNEIKVYSKPKKTLN